LFLITGASSGIGRAAARSLAYRKQKVIAVGRNTDRLNSLVNEHPEFIQSVVADFSSDSGIEALSKELQYLKNLYGVVHAAGSAVPLSDYHCLDNNELAHHFFVHVAAPIALNNALSEKLKGARVMYIDSYSASTLRIGWAAYSIVKSAAQMAARLAAVEMSESKVIRVFPGGVRTPLIETVIASDAENETVEAFRKIDIEGQLVEPDVVGEYLADILLLATDEELNARESWDFGKAEDHLFLSIKSN